MGRGRLGGEDHEESVRSGGWDCPAQEEAGLAHLLLDQFRRNPAMVAGQASGFGIRTFPVEHDQAA